MPFKGFKCRSVLTGQNTCTPDECLKNGLRGEGCKPATYVAVLIDNMGHYDNKGTISGSSLHRECYGQGAMLKLLDYYQEPGDLHWASYRGQNVHDSHERVIKDHPDFKDWLIEDRYYATLDLDDNIERLDPPAYANGEPNWDEFAALIAELRPKGILVLSGQVDAYDASSLTLWDYKTAKWVPKEPKESWMHQLNMYRVLLELHGHKVNRIRVSCMDASVQDTFEVPLFDLEKWVPEFLVPKARLLAEIQEIDNLADAEAHCEVNFLCSQQNKAKKSYCPVADQCGVRAAWAEGNA